MMRGGTSRGPFFLRSDLPSDVAKRDALLVSLMGSGHALQIDGIGGGHALTSKVAIISPSQHPGADVDYLFAQVHVLKGVVDTSPNCGNMLSAVGPLRHRCRTDPGDRRIDARADLQRKYGQDH